jgi:hypothetical protein
MKKYTISIIDNDCKFDAQNKMLMMWVNGLNQNPLWYCKCRICNARGQRCRNKQ